MQNAESSILCCRDVVVEIEEGGCSMLVRAGLRIYSSCRKSRRCAKLGVRLKFGYLQMRLAASH
jgi:hypothetical protein